MTDHDFERIDLEEEQQQLLLEMVEEYRLGPRDDSEFWLLMGGAGSVMLQHMGTNRAWHDVREFDLSALERAGLLAGGVTSGRARTKKFDVTPRGLRYFDWLRNRESEPAAQVEDMVRSLVDADWFTSRYPGAHERWSVAVAMLWAPDVDRNLSQIGHLCREAMQEFAEELAGRAGMAEEVDGDKAHTINRVRHVVANRGPSGTPAEFNDALVAYWGVLSDQVMRQEHAWQKEGAPIDWEDARRVALHTLVVLYEVARAVEHGQ